MPRRKLSEYRAKSIITDALGLTYVGWSIADGKTDGVTGYSRYVVKVDQAVKGRFKKGLVVLDVAQAQLQSTVQELADKGYQSFLIEPYVTHDAGEERYIAISYDRSGYKLSCSRLGGVDIESSMDSIVTYTLTDRMDWQDVVKQTGLGAKQLQALHDLFKSQYFTLLEINPYLASVEGPVILDSAVEVDDAGAFFATKWDEADIRSPKLKVSSPEEREVRKLDASSPASFNLNVLNENGSIFLLLSGGGASVVIADEIYNLGLGRQLANYGEYSGNPTTEEACVYTSQVLRLLVKSSASRKILFIGGAVANFTDIANTFSGVISAIETYADKLRAQHVKIYVRRGGPRQEIGLKKIRDALNRNGLLGGVYDPTTSITDALGVALEEVKES